MKIFKLDAIIIGMNDVPEPRMERIASRNLAEACDLVASICRNSGMMIKSIKITETRDCPLSQKTVAVFE